MLSCSASRYLLAVYQLSGGREVRSADIARQVNVSRSGVVKMLKQLQTEGFIQKEPYGTIRLTPLGIRLANQLYTEYTILFDTFHQQLGVDEATAHQDALSCMMYLSPKTKYNVTEFLLKKRKLPANQQ